MLNDDDLNQLRWRFVEEVMRRMRDTDHAFETWTELLAAPSAKTISDFLDEPLLPDEVAGALTAILLSIGLACAGDVLHGAPLPLDWNGASMRRWHLRRELAGLVEGMTDAQLQGLVFRARGPLA